MSSVTFSVSCYCMGDIMIDKVWGKVGFDVGNGNKPKPRSGWCMPRWLGHCVTWGRFQWDFLINQTNCKLLIRYNSSLTPQTLAHRYEKAILRIKKNNKCIMPTLLFIIVSWKLIFLRWKCLKLRLFFSYFWYMFWETQNIIMVLFLQLTFLSSGDSYF